MYTEQKESRRQKIQAKQESEMDRWGFHARDRRGPWIYKVARETWFKTHIRNHTFDCDWFRLEKDGLVVIKASSERAYAWDGCTPKVVFGKKQFILGTPDGYQDSNMFLPVTGYASLVHDAFYQYLHVIPVKKKVVDEIFKLELQRAGFWFWPVYYLAVRLFGGITVKQQGTYGRYYREIKPIADQKQAERHKKRAN